MKNIFIITFFLTTALGAQTLQIQETINSRILGTTPQHFETLKQQANTACEQWKVKPASHLFRSGAQISAQCSKPKFDKLKEKKKVYECWNEVHPQTGQTIQYCGDQWKTIELGYQGTAVGTREITLPEKFDRKTSLIEGESFIGDKAQDKAWADYLMTCSVWLKDTKAKLGDRLVYAGCRGAEKDTLTYSANEGIHQYGSEAVVIEEN